MPTSSHYPLDFHLGIDDVLAAIESCNMSTIKNIEASAGVRDFVAQLANYIATTSTLDKARDLALVVVIGHVISAIEDRILKFGIFGSLGRLFSYLQTLLFAALYELPGVRTLVRKRVDKELAKIEPGIIERSELIGDHLVLPEKGFSKQEIESALKKLQTLKRADWQSGAYSGTIYHGGDTLRELQTDVFGLFTFANQLHPDCFPEVRKMESELVSMVLDLYNAPKTGCGTTTSGGTESLLLACLVARERAKRTRGLTKFEIIAPITAHAGFDKAAYYFDMELVHAPLDKKTMQVDLNAVKRLIGPNTVLLVGSAPNFPHGIIDDIQGLSKIALENDILLHVDACLGSFIVPFVKDTPPFDFRVPGVTSISCDTHKYGFAPKGSSVIMYRTPELRRLQYFVATDWTGGLYASPTLAGSRPGALSAAAWATLLYVGYEGYKEAATEILETARKIKAFLLSCPDLYFVYGDPVASVVAFGSHQINVYDVDDEMKKRGWHMNALQNPPAVHMASTYLTKHGVDKFLKDLREVGELLAASGSSASSSSGTKALYGVAGSVQTAGVAEKLAEGFIDFLYKA